MTNTLFPKTLQARRNSAQKELDELTARLAVLMNEKQELEAKTQVLERNLKTWQAHVEEMFADPVRAIGFLGSLRLFGKDLPPLAGTREGCLHSGACGRVYGFYQQGFCIMANAGQYAAAVRAASLHFLGSESSWM